MGKQLNGLFITMDNRVKEVSIKDDLDAFYEKINCDSIQIVNVNSRKLPDVDALIILDEEGKIHNKDINQLATKLYGNPYDFIVGDVLVFGEAGEDLRSLTTDEMIKITSSVNATLEPAETIKPNNKIK